jgi:hypothetical protein
MRKEAVTRWLCWSAVSTGVTHSSSGFSADDSTTGSRASANVAGEDVVVHAVATSILLLSQDFLEQVRTIYVLLQSPLVKSCLIWCYGRDLFCCYQMVA